MKPYEVIRAALDYSGRTPTKVSLSMGRAHNYLTKLLKRKTSPSCETMALILSELGFRLVARSNDGEVEYIIQIPEKDMERQMLSDFNSYYDE